MATEEETYTVKELQGMTISYLRRLVNESSRPSEVAKKNRWYLSKDQLILNLTGDPEIAARVKAKMFPPGI